jgi:2-amino-4,5-dihydroxy-6-oxo-7-(phosphonooxy)heptanoate synthase
MPVISHPARSLRLRRLFRHHPDRLMVVPVDHPVSDGPVLPRGTTLDALVGRLAAAGVDAVCLHKGSLRQVRPERFLDLALVVHLSASTRHAPDPDAKYLVTDVAEAVRLGADAVSVHVNLGADTERQQLEDLGRVGEACDRWNVPLLVMAYPRGPRVTDPRDPELVAHAVTAAAELGADVVKTVFPGSVAALREVTASSPVPVLVAGGPRRPEETSTIEFVRDAILGGAAGVAMGRGVFQSRDPRTTAEVVARLVHGLPQRDHRTEQQGGESSVIDQTVLARR